LSDLLFASAILGRDAEEFVNSELGRYLISRAKREKEQAQVLLNKTSPWRRRRIQQLQNEIWRAESLEMWICELIMDGRNAERVLDEQNSE
jgi:hypothetical protein